MKKHSSKSHVVRRKTKVHKSVKNNDKQIDKDIRSLLLRTSTSGNINNSDQDASTSSNVLSNQCDTRRNNRRNEVVLIEPEPIVISNDPVENQTDASNGVDSNNIIECKNQMQEIVKNLESILPLQNKLKLQLKELADKKNKRQTNPKSPHITRPTSENKPYINNLIKMCVDIDIIDKASAPKHLTKQFELKIHSIITDLMLTKTFDQDVTSSTADKYKKNVFNENAKIVKDVIVLNDLRRCSIYNDVQYYFVKKKYKKNAEECDKLPKTNNACQNCYNLKFIEELLSNLRLSIPNDIPIQTAISDVIFKGAKDCKEILLDTLDMYNKKLDEIFSMNRRTLEIIFDKYNFISRQKIIHNKLRTVTNNIKFCFAKPDKCEHLPPLHALMNQRKEYIASLKQLQTNYFGKYKHLGFKIKEIHDSFDEDDKMTKNVSSDITNNEINDINKNIKTNEQVQNDIAKKLSGLSIETHQLNVNTTKIDLMKSKGKNHNASVD